jgi:hypothetical protein
MKRLLLSAILGVGLLFYAAQAPAYVVQTYVSGYTYALGITDLTIDSLGTYDVSFYYGTPSSYTFVNLTDAKTAADAINVALNAYAIDEVADTHTNPWQIFANFAVPYEFAYDSSYHVASSTGSSAVWSTASIGHILGAPFMMAVFTPSASVPIPGALWLLGSGLIGLIGLRRFRK